MIGKVFEDYYKTLFTFANPIVSEELLDAVHSKATDQMNSSLTKEFKVIEVERALKQMFPIIAPSLDRMPPFFYQQFWSIVGMVTIKTVLDFLNCGITPPNFNETHIVLIPKVKNPRQVTEYRLISMYNVAYKPAFKTLVNRLNIILLELMCENQSAFMFER